jgi:hypothetical protein
MTPLQLLPAAESNEARTADDTTIGINAKVAFTSNAVDAKEKNNIRKLLLW